MDKSNKITRDVFISHASEDKPTVVRPLAEALKARGITVWLDEAELTLGDSLRRSIDQGLSTSRFGVVVLSHAFFSKQWPQKELDGLVARKDGKEKVILPVWHGLGKSDVTSYSPLLADKLAVSTSKGISEVAAQIVAAIRKGKRTSDVGSQTEPVTDSPAHVVTGESLRAETVENDLTYVRAYELYNIAGDPVDAEDNADVPQGGAVRFGSKYYIRRPSDDYFEDSLRRSEHIAICGPRQFGKTSLIARGIAIMLDAGCRVAFTDFQGMPPSAFASYETFMEDVIQSLECQVPNTNLTPRYAKGRLDRILAGRVPKPLTSYVKHTFV